MDNKEKATKYHKAQQVSPVHTEMAPNGSIRIVAFDKIGEWGSYTGIATLEHEGELLIAVTEYLAGGALLPDVVYSCRPVFG